MLFLFFDNWIYLWIFVCGAGKVWKGNAKRNVSWSQVTCHTEHDWSQKETRSGLDWQFWSWSRPCARSEFRCSHDLSPERARGDQVEHMQAGSRAITPWIQIGGLHLHGRVLRTAPLRPRPPCARCSRGRPQPRRRCGLLALGSTSSLTSPCSTSTRDEDCRHVHTAPLQNVGASQNSRSCLPPRTLR